MAAYELLNFPMKSYSAHLLLPPTPIAPQWHARTACDADEHAGNLSRWEQVYNQSSPGHFEGIITELCLPDLQIFLESANQALHQSCAAWSDTLWIGIPYASGSQLRLDAQTVPQHALLIRRGGQQFELQTPRDGTILGVVIDEQILGAYLSQTEHMGTEGLVKHGTLSLPSAQYNALYTGLVRLLSSQCAQQMPHPDSCGIRARVLSCLGDAITAATTSGLNHNHLHVQQSWQLVKQARELTLSQADQGLSISNLCRQMCVSRRTLQYAFQETTELSPHAFLRMLKLNQVRRQLRSINPSIGTVTQAAMAYGFHHLGQFSQDYRKLFGERPSNTLGIRAAQAV